MSAQPLHPFWCQPIRFLFREYNTSEKGLSAAEAARRAKVYGPNTFVHLKRRRLIRKIVRKLAEPLVLILLAAAAIAAATGDPASFGIIGAIIAISITLDVVQEHRAENVAEALKRSVAIRVDGLRDGKLISFPIDEVVPGDVISLRAGDLVPADGVVISSRNAHANEAVMTGEPYPAEKRSGPCTVETAAEAFNALFAGTSIVSGEALMLVVATGPATRFGGIAEELEDVGVPSALEREIHNLGLLIMRLTAFLVLFVLLINFAFGRPVLESFLFAVALAVGLTPELLPMIMTVTLSRGAIRMSRKSVIVKRLAAIHDLGAMDVLCTDKTGTLTEAKIALVKHVAPNWQTSERTFTLALINSTFSSGIRSALDEAVMGYRPEQSLQGWKKLDEIPFDFERRALSVLVEGAGERYLVMKGAPENIVARSTMIEYGDGQAKPLTDDCRAALFRDQEKEAAYGHRLLGVAWKRLPADCRELEASDEINLVFAGYCAFMDPPKASARAAIARLSASGVRVKVLSGDHEAVVRHVARELKIPADNVLTGGELAKLTDSALLAWIDRTDLFARVSPDQKTRIIRALQARGHIVGFLGDGVNDAPAIHAAEVGLSVEGATDVARSAADMILLAPDLSVLADGVVEGRRTFTNILKYVRMGTSSNFGNMLSMALASLVLPFLPLLPVQILLNNLLYDLSEIGIPFDEVDQGDVKQPRTWSMKSILQFTLIMGAVSSLFDIVTFGLLIMVFRATPEVFRTAWFVESTATQILVIFIIRTHADFISSRPSSILVATSLGALAAALLVVFSPLAPVFGFGELSGSLIAAVAAVVLGYLVSADRLKTFAMGTRAIRH